MDLRFHGLYAIGCVIFIFNMCIFFFNCAMTSLRFYHWPHTFKASFLHPTESLFVPAFVISIATDLINIAQYGLEEGKTGPWLVDTLVVFYWIYVALALGFSIGILLIHARQNDTSLDLSRVPAPSRRTFCQRLNE